MRQEAGQIDFQPKVYLYFAEDNSVEAVNIPIEKDAVSREHIEKVEERDDRIDAFVSRLDNDWETTLSFEDNVDTFFQTNKVRREVKQIIYNVL